MKEYVSLSMLFVTLVVLVLSGTYDKLPYKLVNNTLILCSVLTIVNAIIVFCGVVSDLGLFH